MWRATTPVLRFELPEGVSINDFQSIIISLAQHEKELIKKTEKDVAPIDDRHFELTLTETETKLFQEQYLLQIQIRALDKDGHVVASNIVEMPVKNALNEENINGNDKN